jgi:lipase
LKEDADGRLGARHGARVKQSMPPKPEIFEVPVRGGPMTVGRWGSAGPVIVASHGITGSLMLWTALVEELGPGFLVIAPDHRGRGGSASLPPPFGIRAHAADLIAVMDELSLDNAIFVGNSMGAAVVAQAAADHPNRARAVILVDGGVPVPEAGDAGGLEDSQVRADLVKRLGPSIDRLSMTFDSADAYRTHWQAHPAFRAEGEWSSYLDAYIEYDLAGRPPAMHSRVQAEAVLEDAVDLRNNNAMASALSGIKCEVVLIRAPFGALGGNEPNIPLSALEGARAIQPKLAAESIEGTNHLTITIGRRGAIAIARWIKQLASKAGGTLPIGPA